MKKFITHSVIFILANLFVVTLLALFLSYRVEERGFKNWQTESNLLMLKNDTHYNLVFMGISHARNLSRHYNQPRVEKILKKSICNIAQGGDMDGAHVQYLYLKYLYDCGNTADTVVVFASPVIFYAGYMDKNPLSFSDEPFKPDFFWLNVKEGCENKWEQLFYYVRNKFDQPWAQTMPDTTDTIESGFLTKLDTATVAAGLKEAYSEGMNDTIFKEECDDVIKIVELARAHHSKVIFILPPALFGKWPGTEQVVDFLKQLQPVYHTNYYDFSDSIREPSMYYDHHHLNTKGVVYFTKNYLKPILGK